MNNEHPSCFTIGSHECTVYKWLTGVDQDAEDPEKLEMPFVLDTDEREERADVAENLLAREEYFSGPELIVLDAAADLELFTKDKNFSMTGICPGQHIHF